MLTREQLTALADRLVQVPGVVGVMLGGSRARDDFTPDSDYDLGLYYRPPLDVDALGRLAIDVVGPEARVTARGDWGSWVDGGGSLTIDGVAVDWIYRDLDRAQQSWADAQAGRGAEFLVVGAGKAVRRRDTAYVAGCLFRVVGLCAHALHGNAGRWLINEKGAVEASRRLPEAPVDFAELAQVLLGHLGRTTDSLAAAVDAAEQLVTDVRSSCRR